MPVVAKCRDKDNGRGKELPEERRQDSPPSSDTAEGGGSAVRVGWEERSQPSPSKGCWRDKTLRQ